MKIKKTKIAQFDAGGQFKSIDARFVCDVSDKRIACYETPLKWAHFDFQSKEEKDTLLKTLEKLQYGDFFNFTENYIEWADTFDQSDELPICNEHLNSTVEEGNIFQFLQCGHTVAMWFMPVDKSILYCPKCGEKHILNGVEYDSEPRRISEFLGVIS